MKCNCIVKCANCNLESLENSNYSKIYVPGINFHCIQNYNNLFIKLHKKYLHYIYYVIIHKNIHLQIMTLKSKTAILYQFSIFCWPLHLIFSKDWNQNFTAENF